MNKELLKIIFQSCVPGIICFAFLTVFISLDRTFKAQVLRKFFLAIFSALLLLSTDAFDYYFHYTNILHQHWALLAAFGFTYRISTIGFIASISNRKTLRFHKFIYVIMAINTIISFLSIKFGLYYYFDESFQWHAGPLFFLPYVFGGLFALLILYSIVVNFKANYTEAVMIIMFTVTCIISNVLEIFEIQHLALSQTLLIVIVFYYLCLNVQLYRLDALTSLMNRRCLYSDLKRLSRNKLIVVSMNINNLEEFNKNEGYREGDKVVVTCAAMMSDSFKPHALVYRANGDEFIAVFKNKTLDLAMNCVSKLQRKMRKTDYRIAIGFTEYFPGNNLEEIIYIAREKMHENKEFLKKDELKF